MCFSSKPKTPKAAPPPAPEPVPLEEPKGIEFGSEESGSENSDDEGTKRVTRIDREGDSSEVPPATAKATSPKRKQYSLSASSVKRSLTKAKR